ncbi:5-methyltetrahydropteroyltriglutamate--homocysteine S-methyltransferase, partial [Buchnera aphidicola]|nr:5-methyltetrahydropteroyltriglutamate--homocysteine S-methyltransferase [Buchnera aphidicola]
TYFDSVKHNMDFISKLPIQGIHIDLVFGKYNLTSINSIIPKEWILSLGVINGRNIWKADLVQWFEIISEIMNNRSQLLLGSSCSLLHTPIDLTIEKNIDNEAKSWFSFAVQKCFELSLLSNALKNNNCSELKNWSAPIYERRFSRRVHKNAVQIRTSNVLLKDYRRVNKHDIRAIEQSKMFNLPILPTTTIGSFPQTSNIRKLRSDLKLNLIDKKEYNFEIRKNIKDAIKIQEDLDLDVLVHGEFERNDMV